jgi:hypothetical protein
MTPPQEEALALVTGSLAEAAAASEPAAESAREGEEKEGKPPQGSTGTGDDDGTGEEAEGGTCRRAGADSGVACTSGGGDLLINTKMDEVTNRR